MHGNTVGAGGPTSRDDDDSEVEALLQRVSESRHAAERRDALARLRDMLQDSPQVRGPAPRRSGRASTARLPVS